MPIRTATYALARPVPYLLERGVVQTIQAPIRHGADGALVAPSVAGSSVSVVRPDSTLLVDAQAITVTGDVASYDLTPAATESLGEGWEVRWKLTIATVVYPIFRSSAYLCEYVPPNVISAIDLYERMPELRYRIPQAQGDSGDDTGWQPQIDSAYYELLRRLIDDGRRPWLIREVTGYREWLLARAVQLCVQAVPGGPDSAFTVAAKQAHFEVVAAAGRMRLQYSSEPPTRRRGGSPTIRLAPIERVRGW